MRPRTREQNKLLAALKGIPVIDAHEHLVPEPRRVAKTVDFFLLFSAYTRADLFSAGMNATDYPKLEENGHMPQEKKWELLRPHYPMIRHGSYFKAAKIWLNDVLGFDDLTEKNYKEVSAALQEGNKPGIYKRVLSDMCHIETALVVPNAAFQIENRPFEYAEYDSNLLKPIWHAISYRTGPYVRKFLETHDGRAGIARYLEWMEEGFDECAKTGVFGVKTYCEPLEKPDPEKADTLLKSLRTSRRPLSSSEQCTLSSVVYDKAFQLAAAHGLTVAVHSGVWGDFRESGPGHLIPVAMRYPHVPFDLFHLGMPYVREAVMVGKMFPNVTVNLCWVPVLSQTMTVRMLDECLDMLPLNNVIVFGADYGWQVEKVYGHLAMTKEAVAEVLANRIERQEMDLEEAVRIAELWFYHNPKRIYALD
ncbi:MAG: amidohydrolase family protein [Kiritimatiellae bacterium]|nr:amidohydrolase family protein [Kiritimatiellia bacterium]